MYAIKLEDRYLIEVEYGSIKTSATPKTYKDLRSAKAALDKMIEAAKSYEESYTRYALAAEHIVATLKKRLIKIDETRAELYEKPYKAVFERIRRLEKEREKKLDEAAASYKSIAPWKRDATRMRAFVAKKPQIVVVGDRPLDSVDILDILKV